MLGTQHKNVTSLLFTHLIRTADHLFVSPSITPLLRLKLASSTNGSRHRLLFPGTIILLCLGFLHQIHTEDAFGFLLTRDKKRHFSACLAACVLFMFHKTFFSFGSSLVFH